MKKYKLKNWVKEVLAVITCMIILIMFAIIYTNRIASIEKSEQTNTQAVQVNFTR